MDFKDYQAGQTQEIFWFKAKNDLINVLMKKACKNKNNLKILNLGVGTGDDLSVLQTYGENYVIDIDQEALSVVDDKLCVEKKIADACMLPYADTFFDAVVSFDVFEHIENDQKAVSEVYRVLKDDGMLIFTVPAFQCLCSSHDKALLHYRRYSKKSIQTLLSRFETKIFFWNSLLFFPIAAMRILKRNSEPKVDHMGLPSLLNTLFYTLLMLDNFLIQRGISMPIGLSLVGFGMKRK